MKLSHLSILFVGLLIIIIVKSDIKSDNLVALADAKNDMDFFIIQAMESTAEELRQVDSDDMDLEDREEVVESFYTSMYSSLGILSDPIAQERFRAYVPVMAITTTDGYYIMYNDEFIGDDGYSYISRRWTEKLPYVYKDENFIYRLTLDTDLKIYDKNNLIDPGGDNRIYDTTLQEIRTSDIYSILRDTEDSGFLLDDESSYLVRQQAVISSMERDLSWYVSRHNDIAKRYGISYRFALPVANNSDWAKTIEGTGIIILFQGMPLIEDATSVYNQMAFAGSGIRKGRLYYVEQHGWYYLYHLDGCRKLAGNLNIRDEHYYSSEECAKLGAYACEVCDPEGVHAPDYDPFK